MRRHSFFAAWAWHELRRWVAALRSAVAGADDSGGVPRWLPVALLVAVPVIRAFPRDFLTWPAGRSVNAWRKSAVPRRQRPRWLAAVAVAGLTWRSERRQVVAPPGFRLFILDLFDQMHDGRNRPSPDGAGADGRHGRARADRHRSLRSRLVMLPTPPATCSALRPGSSVDSPASSRRRAWRDPAWHRPSARRRR